MLTEERSGRRETDGALRVCALFRKSGRGRRLDDPFVPRRARTAPGAMVPTGLCVFRLPLGESCTRRKRLTEFFFVG